MARIILATYLLALLVACSALAQQQTGPMQPLQDTTPTNHCNLTTTKPAPEVRNYSFEKCIVAQLGAYVSFGDGKYLDLKNGTVTNSSKCESNTAGPNLTIQFDCGQININIDHEMNGTKTFIKSFDGFFYNATEAKQFHNYTAGFNSSAGHYYKCNSEQAIVSSNSPDFKLVLTTFAFEAYRGNVSGTDFYQIPEECSLDSDSVSDLVRIGVGICLIALVAIVLVAYFIGRRRWSERSSYESV